ncbi:MAG: CoA-binding protein [Peptococcaceae bacterium]|jgi:predicted CoA-binding protein|nr:CoA-binding protein [Peptococcaceae bacterium]
MSKTRAYPLKDGLNTGMSYAILAKADRLQKRRHAWKAWQTLKDFGCKTYLVAPDMERWAGTKVFPDLASLQNKIDVVVPCLRNEYLEDLVPTCESINAKYIWFQENNGSPEMEEQCREKGIRVVKGCVLKHKQFKKPLAYFNPCYWHGRKENKVPDKYQIRAWK